VKDARLGKVSLTIFSLSLLPNRITSDDVGFFRRRRSEATMGAGVAARRVVQRAEPEAMPLRAVIRAHSRKLGGTLAAHLEQVLAPAAAKGFRTMGPAEVARLLGIQESTLREFARENGIGSQEKSRRSYTVEDLGELRRRLEAGSRVKGKYIPARREGDHLQVIVLVNFKGGSAKTTTSAHLMQYLALRGYRTLGIDLDPQASLTALLGVSAEIDIGEADTMYGAIRLFDERRPMSEIVRPTYLPNLKLAPGGLEIMEFEHEVPRKMMKDKSGLVFDRVQEAIGSVESDYDVVVIDCPPNLGFLTLSALAAATAAVITIHPQFIDVMSMQHFLTMTCDFLDAIAEGLGGEDTTYDWMRYLVTRYEPNDGPQNDMVALLRSQFGPYVLNHPALKSTAISDAGLTNQTVYEVDRSAFNRATYDRAVESIDAVNGEIEGLIRKAWGRT